MKITTTMELPVKLTDEELLKYTKDLVELLAQRLATEGEKKATNSKYKELLDQMDNDIDEVANKIRSGKERRPIECFEEPNITERVVDIYRKDTGECVHTRVMSDADAQLDVDYGKDQ